MIRSIPDLQSPFAPLPHHPDQVNRRLSMAQPKRFNKRVLPRAMASPQSNLAETLALLDQISARSAHLKGRGDLSPTSRSLDMPRYLYIGPQAGSEPIRLGLFAGIHGDEMEGVRAVVSFLNVLERSPELGTGYCLFVYPVCNPTGFEDSTRHSRSGKDLNREFWKGSGEPEVRWLESELRAHTFDGIVSLHTDDSSDGFYGYARGATLTEHLLLPTLDAAGRFLPINRNRVIDGFHARDGIIRDSFTGTLRAPPDAHPRPFEITLESPRAAPEILKEAAFVAALRTILTRYREFIAYAPNL